MKGDEQQLIGSPSGPIHAPEPVLARAPRTGPIGHGARERRPDLPCTRRLQHLGGRADRATQMLAIVARHAVVDDRGAGAVQPHAPAVSITQQDAHEPGLRQSGHAIAMSRRGFPGCRQRLQRGMYRRRLKLESIARVQIGEFVGVMGLDGTGPRTHVLVHVREYRRRRMERQIVAERGKAHAGPQQQGRRMHGAGGHDDGLRPNVDGVPANACLDATRGAAIDQNSMHVATHHDACTLRGGILQVGDQRRLLRAAAASHATVATRIILRAVANVARQEAVVPPQLLEAANQYLVPPRWFRMIGVDAEPASDRVERACEFDAFEVWQAVLVSPLAAHAVRRVKARRVVDHGPAAERRPLQHDEPQIARREQAAGVVQRFEGFAFLMREIRFVAIAALFQHDHVPSRGRELSRHDASARSGADHDNVAIEGRVGGDGDRTNRLGRLGRRGRAQWTRIPDGARGSWRRVVRDGCEPLQGLKRFAPLRQAAGCPAAQAAFAFAGGHARERFGNAAEEQIDGSDIEQPQQQIEVGAIGGAGKGGDPQRDPVTQIRRGGVDQRRRHHAQHVARGGRQRGCQRSWTNVSLKPSGSLIMNTRPHGMSCGSWSSAPPRALISAAS